MINEIKNEEKNKKEGEEKEEEQEEEKKKNQKSNNHGFADLSIMGYRIHATYAQTTIKSIKANIK